MQEPAFWHHTKEKGSRFRGCRFTLEDEVYVFETRNRKDIGHTIKRQEYNGIMR